MPSASALLPTIRVGRRKPPPPPPARDHPTHQRAPADHAHAPERPRERGPCARDLRGLERVLDDDDGDDAGGERPNHSRVLAGPPEDARKVIEPLEGQRHDPHADHHQRQVDDVEPDREVRRGSHVAKLPESDERRRLGRHKKCHDIRQQQRPTHRRASLAPCRECRIRRQPRPPRSTPIVAVRSDTRDGVTHCEVSLQDRPHARARRAVRQRSRWSCRSWSGRSIGRTAKRMCRDAG
jgi:hypothetical protein